MKWSRVLCLCACVSMDSLLAQAPEIPPLGTVDFYGLGALAKQEVRNLLPIREGFDFTTELPNSAMVNRQIADALGVFRVELSLICCTDTGLSQLYVGIQHDERVGLPYFDAPTNDVELPPSIVENYDEFLERMTESILNGKTRQDTSQGHLLAEFIPVRRTQEAFLRQAEQQQDLLVEVLKSSSNASHRAIAAFVLGYALNKAEIVRELTAAVLDPDEGVRNNATRSLAIIAEYANANSDQDIAISADPYIEMLNSIIWTDRNKALSVLVPLTETRDLALLEDLRVNAMDALREMCQWNHWGHAAPACLLLQRIVGLPDDTDPGSRDSTLLRSFIRQ